MEKLLKVAEMRDLEKQVLKGEISYSRMIEIINEKHFLKLVELRQSLNPKKSNTNKLFKEMGFEDFTGNLFKHHKFGIMQFEGNETTEQILYKIYQRGYGECQAIIRGSLGIDK